MKRRVILYAAVLVSWCAFASPLLSQEKMTPIKVAEGVYMFENSRGPGNS